MCMVPVVFAAFCAASPPKHYFQTICTPMQRQHALPAQGTH